MSFKENISYPLVDPKITQLLKEIHELFPVLIDIFYYSASYEVAFEKIKVIVYQEIEGNINIQNYLQDNQNQSLLNLLMVSDYAWIRLKDYVDYSGENLPLDGEIMVNVRNQPFYHLWLLYQKKQTTIHVDFLEDFKALFQQLKQHHKPIRHEKYIVEQWMQRHASGLDSNVQDLRKKNKARIISVLIRLISNSPKQNSKYYFDLEDGYNEKYQKVEAWWNNYHFHMKYAVRDPELLNEMLDFSLTDDEMKLFQRAQQKDIPFFINPYYLSLILVRPPEALQYADKTLRDYIFYSEDMVNEFGNIVAWEKEDRVEKGKPNAAGWLLPNSHNIHRRYPDVAIFIPDTMGRTCAGLCVSCQRMYDFQRGNLGFDLEKLKPKSNWNDRLQELMNYFEFDTQLKDILITGGDSLMSSTANLQSILDAVYEMALQKKLANLERPSGSKYAEIQRIRLGTRIPSYLPQRIDDNLIDVLRRFRLKAQKAGIKEFLVQVHFESPMELNSESALALQKLRSTKWLIVNQQVFTAAASRRGYAARLRQMLNEQGVIPYYTFSVKGFRENRFNYAPNARAVQELSEEKSIGLSIRQKDWANDIKALAASDGYLTSFLEKQDAPFLATDRNVFNLPGVGKSMSYRVVGLTADGCRILMFNYDHARHHSPVVNLSHKVFVVESKSIASYLKQLSEMGENINDYSNLYDYSISLTESQSEVFNYPKKSPETTDKYSNFQAL